MINYIPSLLIGFLFCPPPHPFLGWVQHGCGACVRGSVGAGSSSVAIGATKLSDTVYGPKVTTVSERESQWAMAGAQMVLEWRL